MLETNGNILVESLTEALDTMAFMSVMPPEEELPTPSRSIRVTMDFAGSVKGAVRLMAPVEGVHMIAASIMGIDFEDDEAQDKDIDAFKELLNTTCGIIITNIATSAADVFDLALPEAEIFSDADEWGKFIGREQVTVLDVDGSPMAVELTMLS